MNHLGRSALLSLVGPKVACYRVVLESVYRLPATPEELLDLMNSVTVPGAVLPALQAAMEGVRIFDKSKR